MLSSNSWIGRGKDEVREEVKTDPSKLQEKADEDADRENREQYTFAQLIKETVTSRKFHLLLIGIGLSIVFVFLWKYWHWSACIGLLAGLPANYFVIKKFISIPYVNVSEFDASKSRGKLWRIPKKMFQNMSSEGSMAYVHFNGQPLYSAKEVDFENKKIDFSWIQDYTYWHFFSRLRTYYEGMSLIEQMLEADVFHYTIPQVYGYKLAKERIQNFERGNSRVYSDQSLHQKYTEIPKRQPQNLQGGADVEDNTED